MFVSVSPSSDLGLILALSNTALSRDLKHLVLYFTVVPFPFIPTLGPSIKTASLQSQ